jgi:plastocyanin
VAAVGVQKTLAQNLSNSTVVDGIDVNVNGAINETSVASAAGEEKVQVSIVPGSTLLTDTAYDPNTVELAVGQTVLWINNDSAFHTVTSGEAGGPDAGEIFDSGLAGPLAMIIKDITFEHTFNVTGEYPYYCILHPGMVGLVIVQ